MAFTCTRAFTSDQPCVHLHVHLHVQLHVHFECAFTSGHKFAFLRGIYVYLLTLKMNDVLTEVRKISD